MLNKLVGNIHQSNVIVLVGLFFAAVGIGFAFHGEMQYAFVSLIIAAISDLFVYTFTSMFDATPAEASFSKELKVLSAFAIYGLLPGLILMAVTKASPVSLIVFAFYVLAVAIRLAHFNRAREFQDEVEEGFTLGLPLEITALVLPVLSFLGFVIPIAFFQYILMLVLAVLAVGFIFKLKVPKLPSRFMIYVFGVEAVVCVIWIVVGSFMS